MKTARRLTTAAMFLTALTFATHLQAQAVPVATVDPVLKAIPDDALGFVIINNLGQIDKAISKLGALLQAPVPSVLSLLKSQAGIQEGLDDNGSAAIALLPSEAAEGEKPAPVPFVLFPVTDYKKFIAQFQPDDAAAETTGVSIAGHALIVGHKDSFAVFTLPMHKDRLAKVIASTKSIDSLLESFKPWIGRHQVSVVLTPSGSKMSLQAAIAGLKQFQTIVAAQKNAQQATQVSMSFDMYESILTKVAEEVDAFGVGLNLDDSSNLSIDSHTTFVAGGAWAAGTKDLKPSEGDRFAGLQATPFAFAFEGLLPEEWAAAWADLSASATNQRNKASGGEEMDEQHRKEYAEAMRSIMKGMRSMSFVMASPKQGETLFDGVVALMKVDDSKDYLTRYEKALGQLSEITKDQKVSPFKFSIVKKIEVDGHSGLEITLDLSGMLTAMNNPAAVKMIPVLVGPTGKLTTRIFVADEHVVISTYGNEAHAKQALADYKNPQSNLASDSAVATTLKLLPPHSQWIGLVTIKGSMDFIRGLTSAMTPAGAQVKLPELPATAPIGFAAEAGSFGLDTQMIVPAETLGAVGKLFQQVVERRATYHAAVPPLAPASPGGLIPIPQGR